MSPRCSARGFTLIELLVVLAIVAVMTALASPRVQSLLPGQELRAAAHELASALRRTRGEAIRAGEPRQLEIDLDSGRYALSERVGSEGRLPGRLRIEAVLPVDLMDDRRVGIRFFPDGSSLGGRITLRRDGRAQVIDIDWLTGRIGLARR